MFQYRALNHWDNMDGTVERGYSGNSLWFADGKIAYDEAKIEGYAALLAQIGVNQVSLNNVNVTPLSARLITEDFLPELAKLAEIFRRHGVSLLIAVEFSAPKGIGGLATCDPLDANVAAWWASQADLVYRYIPDLAGFVVKADSEFREGPAALGRTQADGANVIAAALASHGGLVYWRCFVYNCQQDWRDTATDRPKAAYEHFMPLDGQFADNVILQIKYGPLDFQVREPLSPLIGAMKHTRQAVELQLSQEYTGHQIDLYAWATQWREIFAHPVPGGGQLSDICGAGKPIEAIVAVSNVGDGEFLTGHPLAEANLYAFGRFAQDPTVNAEDALADWVRGKFGKDIPALTDMLLRSRAVYEKYASPLGLGFMVNIHGHYGPSPEGYEFMKWGTYHRATQSHIGVDRTKTGTGYTRQYAAPIADMYDDPATTPEGLLLFFHRLPYTYKLRSGKTLIQHIYDTHFEGADEVAAFVEAWAALKPEIPTNIHAEVARRLALQLENAREWRDVVNTYFHRHTGIADEQGRKIYD